MKKMVENIVKFQILSMKHQYTSINSSINITNDKIEHFLYFINILVLFAVFNFLK